MKPFGRSALVAFSLAAFASAPALAQQSQQPQQQPLEPQESASAGASGQQQGVSPMQTSKLIGMKVSDRQDEEIGEIEDVVLDLQQAKVHAVVLAFGGVMGVGGKKFAFQPGELQQGKKKNRMMLDVDKQKLENADGFAKGQWPQMDREYWGREGQTSSAGGSQPQAQGDPSSQGSQQPMVLVRASEITGKQVQDRSGADAGEIKDVVVDLKSGQVRHIVLQPKGGGEAQVQAKQITRGTDDKLVLDMDAQQVKQQSKKK